MLSEAIYKIAIHSDIAKKYGIYNEPSFDVMKNIEYFYDNLVKYLFKLYKRDLIINSWYRSMRLNKMVGGSSKSRHMEGMAVDFYIKDRDIIIVANEIIKSGLKFYKMIIYPKHNFIHLSLDFTNNKRRVLYTLDKKHYKEYKNVKNR